MKKIPAWKLSDGRIIESEESIRLQRRLDIEFKLEILAERSDISTMHESIVVDFIMDHESELRDILTNKEQEDDKN